MTTTTHYVVYESPSKCVALAAMQRQYIDSLMPWVNNVETMRGVLLVPPVLYEREIAWYESLAKSKGSQTVFAILIRDSPDGEYRYVGHTGLHTITFPDARATSGTLIGDPAARGKGVGKHAKMLLLHHAFEYEHLRKVSSEVKAFNAASLGHLVACGYSIIGVRKAHIAYRGSFVDEILLEVHREAFLPLWESYQKTKEIPVLSEAQKAEVQKVLVEYAEE